MSSTNKQWLVYEHTSPSGKVYVGITSKDVNDRWRKDGNGYTIKRKGKYVQKAFALAIRKYGWDNIKHEIILSNITKEEANYTEKYLIRWYKMHHISYNITDGGEGTLGIHFNHTEETINKIKQNHRRCQTVETRQKISLLQTGKKFPKWRRELLSRAHDDEKIAVIQLSMNNEFIAEYSSIMEASRSTGIHNSQISGAIKRNGSAKNFKWIKK